MFKKIFLFFFFSLALILSIFGLGIYFLNKEYKFEHKIDLPLPYQIGGRAPVLLELVAKADVTELSIDSSVKAIIEKEELNSYIPDEPFSLLVSELDSPSIVSLLGKIEFVQDSINVSQNGNILEIAAKLEGEFFVRERKEYSDNEEQPDAGDQLDFEGTLVAQFDKAHIDKFWQLNINSKQVLFTVDEDTKDDWRDRYGSGDYFANLVTEIIDERANNLFKKLETDSSGIRTEMAQYIQNELQQHIPPDVGAINVIAVEVDNCPSVDEFGNISFSLSGNADLSRKINEELVLPNLDLRSTPCS